MKTMTDVDIKEDTIVDANTSTEDGRVQHIVLEGHKVPAEDQESGSTFVPSGEDTVKSVVNQTPLRALCGAIWIPYTLQFKHPLCSKCVQVCKEKGWKVPTQ